MIPNYPIINTQTASSYSTIAALIIGTVLLSPLSDSCYYAPQKSLYKNYADSQNNPSYDSLFDKFSGELLNTSEESFYQEINKLFSQLMASQKPLGNKFEEVLFKNLWNLYEE